MRSKISHNHASSSTSAKEGSSPTHATLSQGGLSPRLTQWSPKEAREKKLAYRRTARMRVKHVNFRNSCLLQQKKLCCHQFLGNQDCGECLANNVKELPEGPRLQIIKCLSFSGIISIKERQLCINGVEFCRGANYGDYLQLLLARRLRVVEKVAITPYETYVAEDGFTKARRITGEQILCITKLAGSRKKHLMQNSM